MKEIGANQKKSFTARMRGYECSRIQFLKERKERKEKGNTKGNF
jgi:hypothetical protein